VLALFSRLLFGFMWLVRFLPIRMVARVGEALGAAAFWLIPERRRVTRINLQKCFPSMDPAERERLARAHFRAFMRSFIDRGVLWWSRPERVERLVQVEGFEHLQALAGERVVLFAPHFLGLDAGGVRLSKEWPRMASMYSRQKDPLFDRLLHQGRLRFGGAIYPRQAGVRKILRAVQAGEAFYYLPDMDFGPKAAVFVPFFGVPAATTVGLSYIARSTGARVVPCVTRMLPDGRYVVRLYPAWTGFPTGDDAADARRMLAFIEERVREMPEQYLWMHKRFKTRPEGEARFY
jgi:Kdo2-lipid IVA lauroyltransferase/acyltransferase